MKNVFENNRTPNLQKKILRIVVLSLLCMNYPSTFFPLADPIYLDTTNITIIYASYGNHNAAGTSQKINVTGTLRTNYANNRSNFSIQTGGYKTLFGDPAYGVLKSLIVIFQYPDDPSLYIQSSNETIPFYFNSRSKPMFSFNPANSTNTGLTVLGAWYGNLNQPYIDTAQATGSSGPIWQVKDILMHWLQNSGTGPYLNLFGGDPAPGVAKGLLAIFKQDGNLYFQVLAENEQLSNITKTSAYFVSVYNGAVAGTAQGIADGNPNRGNGPNNTPPAGFDTDYKAAYSPAYDAAFWPSRGAADGTGSVTSTTTTLPIAPTIYGPIYQSAYSTAAANAFYTATRGFNDATAKLKTTTTPAQSATGYAVYDNAYNAVLASFSKGSTDGSAYGLKIAQSAAPSFAVQVPSLITGDSTYDTAYNNASTQAYTDYKNGFNAGNYYGSTDAYINPPITTAKDILP